MIIFGAGYANPGLPSSDGAVTVSRPDIVIGLSSVAWRFSAHAISPKPVLFREDARKNLLRARVAPLPLGAWSIATS